MPEKTKSIRELLEVIADRLGSLRGELKFIIRELKFQKEELKRQTDHLKWIERNTKERPQ